MLEPIVTPVKPRRSLLYMPATNVRALEKAQTLDADVLIFDMEDSVPPESKLEARANIINALKQYDYGHREVVVRVNNLYSPWGMDDLKAVSTLKISAVLTSKVEKEKEIIQSSNLLSSYGGKDDLPLWLMIETPLGVLNAKELAHSNYRVKAMVAGTADLAKCLHLKPMPGRMPVITSLELIVLAARSNELNVFDGVYEKIDDLEGLAQECNQSAYMGFDGKTLIHPNQIATANKYFSPTDNEIMWSHQIIQAFEEAMKLHKGIALLEGRMIEHLHYENAQRVLTIAAQIHKRAA